MANSITHSKPIAIYGALHTIMIEFRKSDGTTLSPTSLDSEISKDGGTFADCTNEVTLVKEVGGSTDGCYGFLTLTAAEMTADDVTVQIKSANCLTIGVNIRPERLVYVSAATAQAGANTSITLVAEESEVNDILNGLYIRIDFGTGAGQARQILDYDGSTRVAGVRQWETNPANDSIYAIGFVQSQAVNVLMLDAAISSRAATGAAMTLANDAITAAAFDESTAFPLKSADTGSTAVLRTGADSDTGETLSDQLDAIPTTAAPSTSDIKTALEADGSKLDHLWEMTADDGGVRQFTANALELGPIGSGLDAQEVRDAMKLAPTPGDPETGSIDLHLDAIQARTDAFSGLTVTVTSPVSTAGIIRIFGGDDYLIGDARQIGFTLTGAPSISGGSVKLLIGGAEYAGVVTGAAACYFELTHTQTAALENGGQVYTYELIATLSNGHILTPVTGTLIVD